MADVSKKAVDPGKSEVDQQPLHIDQASSLQDTCQDVVWAQVGSKGVKIRFPEQGSHGIRQPVRQKAWL